MTYSPDQLHNAIEAGFAHGETELGALVRLARRLTRLSPPGPNADASRRMRLRFEAVMDGERARVGAGWWPFGAAGARRPSMLQRFAAGTIALSAIGGGVSAATGVTPAEAASGAVHVFVGVVQTLRPQPFLQQAETLNIGGEVGASGTPEAAAAPSTADPGNVSGQAEGEPSPGPAALFAPGTEPSPGPAGSTATPSPTARPSNTPTPPTGAGIVPPAPTKPGATASPTPTAPVIQGAPPTSTPTAGATATPTKSPTPTPSATPSAAPSPTSSPTATPTPHDDDDEPEDQEDPPETPEPEDGR